MSIWSGCFRLWRWCATHLSWGSYTHMQAEEALAASEIPVGCIFVRGGRAIARARNRTNELRNVFSHHFAESLSLTLGCNTGYPPR